MAVLPIRCVLWVHARIGAYRTWSTVQTQRTCSVHRARKKTLIDADEKQKSAFMLKIRTQTFTRICISVHGA
jgi:hypothetical protein